MCAKNIFAMRKVVPVPVAGAIAEAVTFAAQVISQGHVIGVPTDTVYGLACDAQNSIAVSHLYAIKGRKSNNPISICVGKVSHISRWADVKHLECDILNALLPGPVTLVFNRSSQLNSLLNPETNKVGVRIPESRFMRDLAETCGRPLALTSANTSGQSSSLEAGEFVHLWPLLGAVFDAGKLGKLADQRKGSTVVDLSTEGRYEVLRPGVACHRTVELLESFGLVDCSGTNHVVDTSAAVNHNAGDCR